MNKHWVLGLATLVLLTACQRSTQLAVRAESNGEGEEVMGRAQLEIKLLRYDRDSIFVTLARQAPEPEPQPPQDLLDLRDSVSIAQERWREAEASWNDLRSELQSLSERMESMDRTSTEYFQLYRRFEDLDRQLRRLDRDKRIYFDRFTELQTAYTARADSFSAVVASWEDIAFERYAEIVDSLLEARGEELYDTTDAEGWAYFQVPRGRWWIHTRFELPFEELYWSVPYRSGGGADTVILNSSNAEVRPIF